MKREVALSYTLELNGVVVDHGVVRGRVFIASAAPGAHFRCTPHGAPYLPVRDSRNARQFLKQRGFVPVTAGGALYAGVIVFELEDGRLVGRQAPGVRWVSGSPGKEMDSAVLECGPWRLQVRKVDKVAAQKELPPLPAVLVSSFIWAYVLAFGMVALAFAYPFPPPVDSGLFHEESHRVGAMFEEEHHEKKKAPPPEKKTIRTEPLRLARSRYVVHRRRTRARPVKTPRARPILTQHRPTVIDLTKISTAAPSQSSEGATVDLAGPGVSAPVVVAAPPPPPPPPPPMAAAPRPMAPRPKAVKRVVKTKPKRISFPHVSYPEEARQLGIEGRVKLRLYIDEQGRVYRVEVIKGLHPLLDRAAIRAARKARYSPALDQFGKPMKSVVTVSVRFVLEE